MVTTYVLCGWVNWLVYLGGIYWNESTVLFKTTVFSMLFFSFKMRKCSQVSYLNCRAMVALRDILQYQGLSEKKNPLSQNSSDLYERRYFNSLLLKQWKTPIVNTMTFLFIEKRKRHGHSQMMSYYWVSLLVRYFIRFFFLC